MRTNISKHKASYQCWEQEHQNSVHGLDDLVNWVPRSRKIKAKCKAYLNQNNIEFIDVKPLLPKGNFIAGKLSIVQKRAVVQKKKIKWIRFINR